MQYPSVLYERARQFHIDIDEPSGRGFLLVCRGMLEAIWQLLGTDPDQVINVLGTLEYELREISNAFSQVQLQDTRLVASFSRSKYIRSFESVLLGVGEAHSHIFAAIRVQAEGGNEAQVYFEASQRLNACRIVLTRTLQQFRINN